MCALTHACTHTNVQFVTKRYCTVIMFWKDQCHIRGKSHHHTHTLLCLQTHMMSVCLSVCSIFIAACDILHRPLFSERVSDMMRYTVFQMVIWHYYFVLQLVDDLLVTVFVTVILWPVNSFLHTKCGSCEMMRREPNVVYIHGGGERSKV